MCTIVQQLISLGPAAKIIKIDISRNFRNIGIDPGDMDLLGLTHRGWLNLDLSLAIGSRLGAFFFQKLSNTIHYAMTQKSFKNLQNYLDDLTYIGLHFSIHNAYYFLLDLLKKLFQDTKKSHALDTLVVCLRISFLIQ